MVDWLVVDLGGVAADFRPARRLAALARRTGIAPETIHERLFTSGLEHDAELGVHTHESITAAVIERLDGRASAPAVIAAWAEAFAPNEELLATIGRIPARRALFTNNGPMLDACLAGPLAGLAAVFDEVVCSWRLAATKPSSVAFERAAARLACPPSRLCLIDDSEPNVVTARAAGWHAITHRSNAITRELLRRQFPREFTE